MNYEQALALSRALIAAEIGHTVAVGYHEKMAEPVQARVDVPFTGLRGEVAERVATMAKIAGDNDARLDSSWDGHGLTFTALTAHRPITAADLGAATHARKGS